MNGRKNAKKRKPVGDWIGQSRGGVAHLAREPPKVSGKGMQWRVVNGWKDTKHAARTFGCCISTSSLVLH
jgi:hypothetical protein